MSYQLNCIDSTTIISSAICFSIICALLPQLVRLTEGQVELRQELAVRDQRGRDEVRDNHLVTFGL